MDDQIKSLKLFGVIIGLILQACFGGVFRTNVAINSLRNGGEITYFKEEISAKHWLGGLLGEDPKDLSQILAKYGNVTMADAVMTTKITWVDGLCAMFTFCIYTPNTIVIEGHYRHANK